MDNKSRTHHSHVLNYDDVLISYNVCSTGSVSPSKTLINFWKEDTTTIA